MLLRLAIVVLSLMLSVDAAAQRAVPAPLVDAQRPMFDRLLSVEVNSPLSGTSSQVVPLWASPDGRLLAIVALSKGSGAPVLPPSPAFGGVSDLRVVDATDLFSAGLRLRIGQEMRADLTLGQVVSPISYGVSSQANCAFEVCLGDQPVIAGNSALSARAGFGWTPAISGNVDFSFGLSWLDGGDSQLPILAHSVSVSSPIDLGLLEFPDMANYRLDSAHSLSARGSWQSAQGTVVDLTAALGQAELSPIWYGLSGSNLDLNQASLGLGLASGSLRGSIVGRISSLDEPGVIGSRRWGGLDLGVSWRTPWRGEVTVGAQNLWSAPLDPASAHDANASKARMPYVQYRQDL
ncbi:MAG TPA: hypothetical protein VFN25_01430 [Dokdonella sp.]|uniref:hypothetical protein n=1 Tax=Dokdonella sp. TaxID=2291710 RepID=UPI002D7F94B8|nr:hypothetical protein [Dokdonella sp.]HET9031544.1 hypothetical protein [Dokdonella sp.]